MGTRGRFRMALDYLGITDHSSGQGTKVNVVVLLISGLILIVVGLYATIFGVGANGVRFIGLTLVSGVLSIGLGAFIWRRNRSTQR